MLKKSLKRRAKPDPFTLDYIKTCQLPKPSSRDTTFDKMHDDDVRDTNTLPSKAERKKMGVELAEEKIAK